MVHRRSLDGFDSIQMPTPIDFMQKRNGYSLEGLSIDRESVAKGVAEVLTLAGAAVSPTLGPQVTVFDADPQQPPVISIASYIRHWVVHSDCSVDCAGLALGYVLRSRVPVHRLNMHRLMLGALVLAVKWRDDLYYSNEFYAGVGGVTTEEMNRLEAEMLRLCDWAMHIDSDDHGKIVSALSGDDSCTEELSEMLRDGSASSTNSLFGDTDRMTSSDMENTLRSSISPSTANSTPLGRNSDPYLRSVEQLEEANPPQVSLCRRMVEWFCPRRGYEATKQADDLA